MYAPTMTINTNPEVTLKGGFFFFFFAAVPANCTLKIGSTLELMYQWHVLSRPLPLSLTAQRRQLKFRSLQFFVFRLFHFSLRV